MFEEFKAKQTNLCILMCIKQENKLQRTLQETLRVWNNQIMDTVCTKFAFLKQFERYCVTTHTHKNTHKQTHAMTIQDKKILIGWCIFGIFYLPK